LHPAKHEAFGMIIAEAMTARVPVLCSTECGAADLVTEAYGETLPFANETNDWMKVAERLLANPPASKSFSRPWSQVASEYVIIYQKLLDSTNR
jgi:UDP-glucose:(heptosyl)LPS alpha-1,3-glucosyltransferase